MIASNRAHLTAVPGPPDLAQRLHLLGEVVDTLIERTGVLEEQRDMLVRKIEILEFTTRVDR